jgi:predicted tellurium resistance membrane protein TerC
VLTRAQATEFFAGYLLEQSLSIDNLFVFVLLFKSFQVPKEYEGKVLEYGIFSAAVLRAIFIRASCVLAASPPHSPPPAVMGAAALERFRPVLLLFAAILLGGSYKILSQGDESEEEESIENNSVVKFVRSWLPVTESYHGDAFFADVGGVRTATPLLLVLAVIELSDLVFAVDSIPAVFGVTNDPFIVYSSNMFAIAVRLQPP